MAGYIGSIEMDTLKNQNFRQVIFTGKHLQLVLMSLKPGEEIGNEVHEDIDQFFSIEEGQATFILNQTEEHFVHDGDAVVVPAGTYHNVLNSSKTEPLRMFSIYAPPEHPAGTLHRTKADADDVEKQNN